MGMDICSGGRFHRHDDIVIMDDCPACDAIEDNTRLSSELAAMEESRDVAREERDEAIKALADFETDLRASMRMIRDAKRAVEAEDDHT